ncbi:MAG: hypothetical protein ABIZ80_21735, partial [Bryobacteraceae bacterium]
LNTSDLMRVQVNLTPANILAASFLYNYADQARNGLSFLDPVETTINRRQTLYFASLKDQVYFHRGALIEFGFASSRAYTREAPQGDQTFEYLPSGKRGNYFLDLTRHTSREEWSANAYLPAMTWFGGHQLMGGLNVQRNRYERAADRHDYRVLRSDMSVAREVYFTGSGLANRRNLEVSTYMQDRWSPMNGLLIEAGVRADWNEVVRDVMMSPRLSAAYAPKWMRETKVAAGIGIFRDSLNLGTITRHQDQVSISTFFDPSGVIRRGPIETAFQIVDRDLRMPRYRTLSLSMERKLPLEFYGKAAYIRRGGRRGLTFVNELPLPGDLAPFPAGGFYQLRNVRNDRYDAVEVTVRRTFGGRFEFSAGYTRSNSRSDAVVDYSLENPIFALQGPGPFAWDAPNRFVTWGWAPIPKRLLPGPLASLTRDTDVAYLAEYRTGFPFSVVNEESFLLGNPNGRRLPSYFNVNLHVERRFPFLHYLWAWRVGVNNLTNSGNPNVVNNVAESPTFLSYGRGQQRAVNVRLRFLGRR